uniref:Uncharacterized protein n=1 Tax=Setaria italica TaxID=4555 RepID=K3Z1J5_SETIT
MKKPSELLTKKKKKPSELSQCISGGRCSGRKLHM